MVENRTWGRNKAQSFVPYGDNKALQRVNDATVSTNQLAISGETVNFSAGAAGTTGVVALDVAPIYNATGSELGHYTSGSDNNTSFAWVTGTVLTIQVPWKDDLTDTEQLAELAALFAVDAKGRFALNYDTGKIRYCKETTGTSDTCNYSSRMMNIDVTGSSVTANQNLTQLNSNTISVNNGVVGTGVQRVTLASDGTGKVRTWDGTNNTPAMDTAARRGYVQGSDGTNSAQYSAEGQKADIGAINGNPVTENNGVAQIGCQRVTIASDSTGTIQLWNGTNKLTIAAVDSLTTFAGTPYGTYTVSSLFGYNAIEGQSVKLECFDADSDAKTTQFVLGANLRTAAVGGSVEGTKITDGTTSVDVTTSNELEVATVRKNKPTVTSATGAAGITATTAIGAAFKLNHITVHFSAAPTTSEDFTVTINANDGAAYDTVIYSVDPSASSATDIVFIPDQELLLESGDEILLGYTNTDTRTYGVRIVTEAL